MPKLLIKAVILIMLLGLTIYQIGLLWFDYPSDRNFFYNIMDQNTVTGSGEVTTNYRLLEPVQIGVYAGRNTTTYNVLSLSNSENRNLTNDGLKVVREAFESGVSLEVMTKDELFDNKHIVFVMPFPINQHILVNDLGVDPGFFEDEFIFERIYIYPAESGDDQIEVVFADSQLNKIYHSGISVINNRLLNDAISQYIRVPDDEENVGQKALTYVSTTQSDIAVFKNEALLPTNGQYFDYLRSFYGDIFFYEGQQRDIEAIEEFFSYFFINPENTWSTENETVVRYGDLDSVVSYQSNGVFEYKLIETIEYTHTNIGRAYEIVEAFLENDQLLGSIEYLLDSYEYSERGLTFYYNYTYRDIPIVFEKSEEKYAMAYPMEITVMGDQVSEYSRIMFKPQEIAIQGNPFEVRFLQPVDILLSRDNTEEMMIDKMQLGYHVGDTLDDINLMWVVEVSEVRYFIELE